MRVTLSLVLLVAAVGLFIAAAFGVPRTLQIGLACFAGAFLAAKV